MILLIVGAWLFVGALAYPILGPLTGIEYAEGYMVSAFAWLCLIAGSVAAWQERKD